MKATAKSAWCVVTYRHLQALFGGELINQGGEIFNEPPGGVPVPLSLEHGQLRALLSPADQRRLSELDFPLPQESTVPFAPHPLFSIGDRVWIEDVHAHGVIQEFSWAGELERTCVYRVVWQPSQVGGDWFRETELRKFHDTEMHPIEVKDYGFELPRPEHLAFAAELLLDEIDVTRGQLTGLGIKPTEIVNLRLDAPGASLAFPLHGGWDDPLITDMKPGTKFRVYVERIDP